jgi:ribulose-phosphate 3-epimerase
MPLKLTLGVKADPIEYRYSYEWLFRIMADEGVRHVQLGSFFELYQLPDEAFLTLRRQAEDLGITVSSVFTSHRELGGFFRCEPGWEAVARRNFERMIQVGALVGALSVGSNPGTVLRDRMGDKAEGLESYMRNMKALMHHAHSVGVPCLGFEPMSCLAEPPTLPDEVAAMAQGLLDYHAQNPDTTSTIGCCLDVSHGYADRDGNVVYDHMQLAEACLPYTTELHLKNTDATFSSTFGFSEEERRNGIVDIADVRDLLMARADVIPVDELIGYLEIGGPKLGRDYSDHQLEGMLRDSLAHLKETFLDTERPVDEAQIAPLKVTASPVMVSPSMMCADLCHLERSVRLLEDVGVDMLHFDLMDAHFVPNMPLGLELIRRVRRITDLPFDVHLMVDDNDFFIGKLADIGVQYISAHVESAPHLDRTLSLIRDSGALAGAALNPATPVTDLQYVLDRLDFVVIMTVNPGFAGQKLVPATIQKIADCRALLDANGLDIPIQVDGNVSFGNIPAMVGAGGDILVAGTSSLFSSAASMRENARLFDEAVAEGLALRTSTVHEA